MAEPQHSPQDRARAAAHRTNVLAHREDDMAQASSAAPGGVSLRAIPFVGQIGIRVALGSRAAAAIEAAARVRLPVSVGEVSRGPGYEVLWLSPDEFLLVTTPEQGAVTDVDDLVTALDGALGDEPGSVVDLSANRVVLELSGPSALAVLEKGCALDLHPRVFSAPAAFQSAIGRVPAIIWKSGDERYYVLPRASFADHLVSWLIDAMREFAPRDRSRADVGDGPATDAVGR